MGASHAKKKAYNLDHEDQRQKRPQQRVKNGRSQNGTASAYADLQWEQQPRHGNHPGYSQRDTPHMSSYVPQPDYMEGDDDLIKPKKLVNPVKSSKSHQELHRELLMSQKRGGVVETKPELQRVLEARKREQMIKQRKQEDEARKKVSPLEQELLKRHKKLEELEKEQQETQDESNTRAPEFVKVKENLRRTSFHGKEEKEV